MMCPSTLLKPRTKFAFDLLLLHRVETLFKVKGASLNVPQMKTAFGCWGLE